MYEKLLLNLFYECGKANIELPWDRVAHRLQPGTSKDAIIQAIDRLRQTCLAEGHMIPPEVDTKDPWTRGFTRVYPDSFVEDDILYCRPVGWYEEVEHPKEKNPTAERLTFNGTTTFKVTYADYKAPVPDEWKEDPSKRMNEPRLTQAQVVALAKAHEKGSYDGASSSNAALSQSAAPTSSSSTAETNTSDAFAGDEDDLVHDENDAMDYGEDEEDEDGALEDETREITPKLEHSHIDSLPSGRRMPSNKTVSRQQSENISTPANSRGATPASSVRGTNGNGMAPQGYMRSMRANSSVRNNAQLNGLPVMNTISRLNDPFPQKMPQGSQPNIANGLENSRD